MKHAPIAFLLLFFTTIIFGYEGMPVKNTQPHISAQSFYCDVKKNTSTFFPSCDKYKHRNASNDFVYHGPESQIQKRPDNWLCISQEQFDEYKKLEPCCKEITPRLFHAIQKRLRVQMEIRNGKECISTQSYQLSKNTIQLLQNYDYSAQELTRCSGNQLQHVIHQESIALLEQTSILPYNSIIYSYRNTLINCAASVCDYNKQGLIDQALCIADFCWTFLDYGQAIAEGVALGLYATGRDFIEHPLETAVCVVAGKQVLVYQLCKVFYNVADIGLTALSDHDEARKKWSNYTEPLTHLIHAIENKQITVRDCIKNGSALVTGFIAQGKLLKGLHSFCKTTQQTVLNFAKNNSLFDAKRYAVIPEGVVCEVVLETERNLEAMSKPVSGNTPNSPLRIMNPSRLILETAYAKIVPQLKKEIKAIETSYQSNIRTFNGKELKIAFEHILGIEIGPKFKIQKFDISGFHHDFCLRMEKSGVVTILDKVANKLGCYAGVPKVGDKTFDRKTFFPSTWSRKQVIDTILEAYDNFMKSGQSPELLPDGKYRVKSFASNGLEIVMNVAQNGEMKTAYPVIKLGA